jgi:transglutaminase-like putative cysteine protease
MQSLLIPRAAPAGALASALPWIGAGAALLALLAARLGARGLRRAWLLLVVLALMPAAEPALRAAQRPLVGALFSLLPEPHGETGFAPLARLRADGLLRPARRAVLRLWVTGGTPPPYLVGSRLTTLDGNYEWRAIEADRPTLVADAGDGERRFRLAAGKPVWSVDIHSLRRDDFMFLPPGTQTVQAADSALSVDGAGALHGAFAQRAARRWHAAGGPTGAQPPAANENLSLPPFWTPELQAAARALGGADAAQTAARIGADLRGRRYSLRYHLDPKAPFRDFFIGRKPAHCFWYATAAALALRANGVPSRLVTGYLVSEPLGGGAFLVRERDAHAWAEWQDGAGRWHTLDATPANYDAVLADYGGGAFERVWQRLAARLDAWWQKVELTDAQVQAVLLAGLAVLVGLFVREYRRLRRVAPRIGHSREWQRLWRRFLRLSGLPERAQWTATDYLAHLPESWPAQRRAAARRFLEIYVAERFSPRGASVEAAAALRACRRRGLSR